MICNRPTTDCLGWGGALWHLASRVAAKLSEAESERPAAAAVARCTCLHRPVGLVDFTYAREADRARLTITEAAYALARAYRHAYAVHPGLRTTQASRSHAEFNSTLGSAAGWASNAL